MVGAFSYSVENRVEHAPTSLFVRTPRLCLVLLLSIMLAPFSYATERMTNRLSTPATDTIVIAANSVEIGADDDAYDFVTQLPCISDFDGELQAYGKPVDRVLIDGMVFYWEDVNSSLRNIPADIVESVHIYGTQSEVASFAGVAEMPATITINVLTIGRKGREIFGSVTGALGLDSRYMGSGSAIRFDSTLRVSVLASANNINDVDIDFPDGLHVLNSELAFESSGIPAITSSGDIDALRDDENPGIARTRSVATMASNAKGPVRLGVSYSMLERTADAMTAFDRQFVGPSFVGGTYSQRDTSVTTSESHRVHVEARVDVDSNAVLLLGTSLRFNSGSLETERRGLTVTSVDTLNSTGSLSTRSIDGTDLLGQLSYVRRLSRPRRYVSINLGYLRSSSDIIDALRSLGVSGSKADPGDTINQRGSRDEAEIRFKPQFTYSEPLGEQSDLKLAIALENTELRTDRIMKIGQFGTNVFTEVDSTLSGLFTQRLSQVGTSAVYSWRDATTRFVSGLEYRQTLLSGESRFPITLSTTRQFRNVLPWITLSVSKHPEEMLQLSYEMAADLPSIDQMQNAVDNSNPLIISRGTPDLNQTLRHTMQTTYRSTIPSLAGLVFASAHVSYLADYIGRSTILPASDTVIDNVDLERGVQFVRPVNLDGALSSRLSGYFGFRLDTLPLKASLNVEASYSRIPGLINGVRNDAITMAGFINGQLEYQPTSYLTVIAGVGYRSGGVDNTTQVDLNNTFSNLSFSGEFSVALPQDIDFVVSARSRDLNGLSNDFNRSILVLDCTLEKALFEDGRGNLRLSVHDALNQGNAISRSFTDAYTEDRMSMVLRRVVLLTFRYRLHEFVQ